MPGFRIIAFGGAGSFSCCHAIEPDEADQEVDDDPEECGSEWHAVKPIPWRCLRGYSRPCSSGMSRDGTAMGEPLRHGSEVRTSPTARTASALCQCRACSWRIPNLRSFHPRVQDDFAILQFSDLQTRQPNSNRAIQRVKFRLTC